VCSRWVSVSMPSFRAGGVNSIAGGVLRTQERSVKRPDETLVNEFGFSSLVRRALCYIGHCPSHGSHSLCA